MTVGKKITNVDGIELVVPKTFEGILPVSPYHRFVDFEPYSFIGLKSCLKSGDIAFDIGSSYGVISSLMAKLVGPSGKVFSFEADREVLEKSKEIITVNELETIIDLNNYLVGNYSQDEMDFHVIPSFKSVASSINPDILQAYPQAVKKSVQTIRIDDFCSSKKICPKCIKIDTEGAEFIVVSGMKNLIKSNSPDLVIETHDREIEGIGGSLKELIYMLESFGYGLFDLLEGKKSDGKDFVLKYSSMNSTLLASKKLDDEKYVKHLQENLLPFIKEVEATKSANKEDMEIRELANRGTYREIINRLKDLPLESKDAYKQYYLALALHMTDFGPKRIFERYKRILSSFLGILNYSDDLKEALTRYEKALAGGFSPFWIYYNLATIYHELGETQKAKENLIMAEKYNVDHPELKALRHSIGSSMNLD